MPVEKVQAFTHREIEQADAVGAHQVQMRAEPVAVFRPGEFAVAEPFQVQRDDAVRAKLMQRFCLYSTDLPGAPTWPFTFRMAGSLPVRFSGS